MLMPRKCYAKKLDEIAGLDAYKVISVTGSGGKTSMLYALGKYFAKAGRAVITTTTKIYSPKARECGNIVLGTPAECAEKIAALPEHSLSAAARGKAPEGKLAGFRPEEVDALLELGVADMMIVEADGARGLSFKCYEDWEPPVPQSTQCQLVMFGADALLKPVSAETIFRTDLLKERYGVQKNETLSAANAMAVLANKYEYLKNSPDGASRVLCVNKCELLMPEQRKELLDNLKDNLINYDAAILCSISDNEIFDTIKF